MPGVDGCVDGAAQSAKFSKPAELAIDRRNNLFVADSFNHVIRKITRDGKVSTVTGAAGKWGAADGINGRARFFNPYGLAIQPLGSLVVADAYNELIRAVLIPFELSIRTTNNASAMIISWDGVIGRKYQVQFKPGIDSAAWLNLGTPVTAGDSVVSRTDTSSDAQRIYRVIVVE